MYARLKQPLGTRAAISSVPVPWFVNLFFFLSLLPNVVAYALVRHYGLRLIPSVADESLRYRSPSSATHHYSTKGATRLGKISECVALWRLRALCGFTWSVLLLHWRGYVPGAADYAARHGVLPSTGNAWGLCAGSSVRLEAAAGISERY